ncbi:hypothetical protein THAOC_33446, partial [Thalassiosira oceanica]
DRVQSPSCCYGSPPAAAPRGKIVLDQFADQIGLNTDSNILKELADNLASVQLSNSVAHNRGGGTLVCGSPNEVAPDPFLDDYFDVIHRDLACIGCHSSYGDYAKQKATVWTMNVIEGEDQMCQRMAWSLYELLNVGAASNPDNTETNLYTYDIFIRHCFGNYFDILKELTYNPKMGKSEFPISLIFRTSLPHSRRFSSAEQFNFAGNVATRMSWDTSGQIVFPDENYAREIMQLYTAGLHKLNPDGTEVRDRFGQVIQTYSNLDILSNARLFTGFTFTARRGNIEELFRSEKSRQDPMRIEADLHDFFPKSTLDGGWLGDRYPLCIDLHQRHFLSVGAKYLFRAGSSLPRLHHNPRHWDADESIKRFVLSKDSELYARLCNPSGDGRCNFANTVTLDAHLPCTEKECRVDTVEIVQVAPWCLLRVCQTGPLLRSEFNFELEYHNEKVLLGTAMDVCHAVQVDTNISATVCDPVAVAYAIAVGTKAQLEAEWRVEGGSVAREPAVGPFRPSMRGGRQGWSPTFPMEARPSTSRAVETTGVLQAKARQKVDFFGGGFTRRPFATASGIVSYGYKNFRLSTNSIYSLSNSNRIPSISAIVSAQKNYVLDRVPVTYLCLERRRPIRRVVARRWAAFNFEAKIVGDRGIDGLGGCQNRNWRTILLWNTSLRYLHGAPPANIGHRQMVLFTVLRRVGFLALRLLLPEDDRCKAYAIPRKSLSVWLRASSLVRLWQQAAPADL